MESYETKETSNLNFHQLQRLVLLKQNKVLSHKLEKIQKERDDDVATHCEQRNMRGPNNSDNEQERELNLLYY